MIRTSRTFRNLFYLAFILLIGVYFTGCSSKTPKVSLASRNAIKRTSLETPTDTSKPPFYLWNYGQDLQGQSITDSAIRRGDDYLKRGDAKGGLAVYRSINEQMMAASLQEALAARKASAFLVVNQPQAALDTLATYFDRNQVGASSVVGQFALLLAYSYGAIGDIDQSLAWFSKCATTESDSALYSDSSELGVRYLLNSIPTSIFLNVHAKWKGDPVLGALVDQEARIRNSDDNQSAYKAPAGGAFWLRPLPKVSHSSVAIGSSIYHDAPAAVKIGVLLPLSGPLAPLGEGTKNGMQIAVEVENENRIGVIFKDSGDEFSNAQPGALPSDGNNTEKLTRQLTKEEGVNFLVGPLLSEQAGAVRTIAVQDRVPQLSLTKANNFETGDIIFRFGATSNSQMDTLLDAASDILGMRNFAVVYPESSFGTEYAAAFKKYLTAKGLQLIYEATYQPSDSSKLASIANELERISIDGLFIPDNIEGARSLLSLLSESFRQKVRAMGAATWDSPQELAQSQAIFQNAIYISPFFIGSTNPLIRKFVDRYKAKHGKSPDFLAAQGFDAMTLAIGAARKVLQTGASFDLALKQIESYDGLTGNMRVDVSGEVHRAYTVIQLKEGRLVPLSRSSLDFNQQGEIGGYQAKTETENRY